MAVNLGLALKELPGTKRALPQLGSSVRGRHCVSSETICLSGTQRCVEED